MLYDAATFPDAFSFLSPFHFVFPSVREVWLIYLLYQLEPRFILSVLACRQDKQCVSPTEQNRTGYASGFRFWNLVALPFPFDSFEPPSTRRLCKIWTHSEKRTYGVPIQNPKRKHSRPLTEVWTVPVSVCSKCDTCFKIECPFLDVTTHESKPALVVEVWNGIDLIPDCHINDLSRVAFLTQEFEIDSP